jgi:CRISPR/Cas system CSM-associated protein Csm3 (group 7 of RAMP superfamily)
VLRENCERLAITPLFNSEPVSRIQSPHTEHLRPFAKTPTLVERIFGSRFREGTVYFDDAIMSENPKNALGKEFFRGRGSGPEDSAKSDIEPRFKSWQVEVRTQNAISRQTGTAVENALFRSEYGLRNLEFSGRIYGTIEGIEIGDTQISDALVLFAAGFRVFDRIGGNKSVGMGRFVFSVPDSKIRVDEKERTLNELIELLQLTG